jgi:guanylate kinase
MRNKSLVVLVGGTSGVGKDTIINELIKRNEGKFVLIVSTTTRKPREGEVDGVHYYFVDTETFKTMIDNGDVCEHSFRHEAFYGISSHKVDELLKTGKIPMKDCDYRGVVGLKKAGYNVISFYLIIDKAEVERRLRNRGMSEEQVQFRLSDYDAHVATKKYFDFVVENRNLEKCVTDIQKIIQGRIN